MGYVSKGRRMMAFVGGEAIAYATNHSLTVTPSIIEDRTKDDGDAPVGEFDTYAWGINTDSVVGVHDTTPEKSVVELIDTMLAMEKVTLAFDAAMPATGSVPASGWAPANNPTDYPATTGEAWIESLSISAASTGYATSSVSFSGEGDLS